MLTRGRAQKKAAAEDDEQREQRECLLAKEEEESDLVVVTSVERELEQEEEEEQNSNHVDVTAAKAESGRECGDMCDSVCGDVCDMYTIVRVGDIAALPVFKFLVYERPATAKHDKDQFVLTIGGIQFGPITRGQYTRQVAWKPNVFLTELDFFSVIDVEEDRLGFSAFRQCLRLDQFRPILNKMAITIFVNQRSVAPTCVFAWCAPPPPQQRQQHNPFASDSTGSGKIIQHLSTKSVDPQKSHMYYLVGIGAKELFLVYNVNLDNCPYWTLENVTKIARFNHGDCVSFTVPHASATAMAFFMYAHKSECQYLLDSSDPRIMIYVDKPGNDAQVFAYMLSSIASLDVWRKYARQYPELEEEPAKSATICLVKGTSASRRVLQF